MRTLIRKRTILFLILLVGAFFRFFKLSEYPIQLNHDEVSQLYDTKSIVQTKKDVYGNFMPLAFPSTGDYKVGHYIYVSTVPYLLLGDKEITIRLPAAFFATLTIIAVFLFIKILTKNWALAALSALMVAVTPSEIFYARKSFENVIGVSLDFFGLFFLLKYLKEEGSKIWGLIGSFILAMAMYIYTSQTMVVPLLIIFLIILLRKEILKQRKNSFFIFGGWLLFIIPLIILTSLDQGLRFRAQSVFITQDVKLGEVISLTGNHLKSYVDFIFAKFLSQFNPQFLFLDGLDLTSQNAFDVGPLLIWQLPFLILGIIFLVKNQKFSYQRNLLFGLTILAMVPSALTFEDFSPHRAMLAFTNLSILSAFGLYWLIKSLNSSKKLSHPVKISIFTIILLGFLVNFTYFIRMYVISFPFDKSERMQYPFKLISQYIWSQYDDFNQIIFDPKFGEIAPFVGVGAHYFLAYYGHYPADKFQREFHYGDKPREVIFDKFSIREVYWPKDRDLKNTLVIASPWSVPENDIADKSKIIKKFYFYNGKLAFYAIKL